VSEYSELIKLLDEERDAIKKLEEALISIAVYAPISKLTTEEVLERGRCIYERNHPRR
jgi:hypothetical protein